MAGAHTSSGRRVSIITALLCAVMGYPPAYFIAMTEFKHKWLLLLLLIVPFWISFTIRTFSWIHILGEKGAINASLMGLGVIAEPLPLLYNEGSVIMGLIHFLLPYMILNVYVTLDGIDVNDPQLATAYTSAIRMTQEALQEFRVSTSNYNAEMGRSSGPQVSLVTRSGTNQFDGSAYWTFRRTATSTNEYFLELSQKAAGQESKAPKLDKDIFGGSFGGPLRRNRLFFFANLEQLKEQSEAPVVRNVPSNSMRDGVLMYQCATAGACPGGSVRGVSGAAVDMSADAGQAYFEARSRCIACARAGDCRALLDAAPDPACALKFCPNAVYFSRCRPDTAPP